MIAAHALVVAMPTNPNAKQYGILSTTHNKLTPVAVSHTAHCQHQLDALRSREQARTLAMLSNVGLSPSANGVCRYSLPADPVAHPGLVKAWTHPPARWHVVATAWLGRSSSAIVRAAIHSGCRESFRSACAQATCNTGESDTSLSRNLPR